MQHVAAHVGAIIKEFRLERGLSQEGLASRTKIDSSNIRSYEPGRVLIGLQSLIRVASVLKVQLDTLIKGLESSMFEKDA